MAPDIEAQPVEVSSQDPVSEPGPESNQPSRPPPAVPNASSSAGHEQVQPPTQTKDQQEQDYDPFTNASPYSPFYRHATPNLALLSMNTSRPAVHDLESGISRTHDSGRPHTTQSSRLWEPKRSCCEWWNTMERKKRTACEIAIAILILGGIVGVPLGITAGVGGGIWKSPYQRGRLGE